FYRQRWLDAGVDLTRLGSAVHLEFLPVLRKCDLPVDMPVDRDVLRRRRWRFVRALLEAGYVPGERVMLISDEPLPAGAALCRWTHADPRQGEDEVFDTFVGVRPRVLYGPLSSLLPIARRLLSSPQVKARPRLVVSTGQQLTDTHRALLERAFNAPLADFYSTAEFGLVAYSLPGRSAYRIVPQEFHIELVPTLNRNGMERLVVTGPGGNGLPLIRFDTGDLVRRDRERVGAPIVQITGRQADAPRLANDHGWQTTALWPQATLSCS
ncbi:MAG TPA: hypothetical protein VGO53_00400, partial [Steroidobacteraceae bacterium]|nr:hypothetical protein [Steroidobacteraceae bacterium]